MTRFEMQIVDAIGAAGENGILLSDLTRRFTDKRLPLVLSELIRRFDISREGFRFYPGEGLERIVQYHERQDARFAEAAHEISVATGKPILTATELAVADPANPGPATVRLTGRLCYASGNRAVTALGHLYRYGRYRERRGLS